MARARAEEVARTNKFIGWLEAVPEAGLSPAQKLNREVVIWDLKTGNIGPERFGIASPQSPYVISQQDGAYFSTPDFLNTAHPIDKASDAEAYLSRLAQFATLLDNETAEQRAQARARLPRPGLVARPRARADARAARRRRPTRARWSNSIATRAAAKGIAGDWRSRRGEDRRRAGLSGARPADRADRSS